MITLNIQVPEARDRTALAAVRRGAKTLATGFAVASTSAQIAKARGNPGCDPLRAWGHPPTGSYRLINHRPSHKNHSGEYGMHFLLFEPQSGAALDAQAAGRVALLAYGGPAGQDKRMRCTQGGVRLRNDLLGTLVKQLPQEDEVMLVIETLRKPSWWQFWKSLPDSPPLSTTATKAYPAPLDEMSIILELMNGATRRSRQGYAPDDRRERDDNRWDDRSRSSRSSSDSDTFQGGGGQSGGAGASGGWDSATTTARGIDGSGRIVAGAAIGAAALIAANAAAGAQDRNDSGGAGFAPVGGDGGSDGGSSGSSGAGTTTSTSY